MHSFVHTEQQATILAFEVCVPGILSVSAIVCDVCDAIFHGLFGNQCAIDISTGQFLQLLEKAKTVSAAISSVDWWESQSVAYDIYVSFEQCTFRVSAVHGPDLDTPSRFP